MTFETSHWNVDTSKRVPSNSTPFDKLNWYKFEIQKKKINKEEKFNTKQRNRFTIQWFPTKHNKTTKTRQRNPAFGEKIVRSTQWNQRNAIRQQGRKAEEDKVNDN